MAPRSWWASRSATETPAPSSPARTDPADVPTNSSNSRASSRARPRGPSAHRPSRRHPARRRRPAPGPARASRGCGGHRALDRWLSQQLTEGVDDALAEDVEVGHRVAVGVEAVVDPAVVGRQPDATAPDPWRAASRDRSTASARRRHTSVCCGPGTLVMTRLNSRRDRPRPTRAPRECSVGGANPPSPARVRRRLPDRRPSAAAWRTRSGAAASTGRAPPPAGRRSRP